MADNGHVRQSFLACRPHAARQLQTRDATLLPLQAAPTGCFSPMGCLRSPGWMHAAQVTFADGRVGRAGQECGFVDMSQQLAQAQ